MVVVPPKEAPVVTVVWVFVSEEEEEEEGGGGGEMVEDDALGFVSGLRGRLLVVGVGVVERSSLPTRGSLKGRGGRGQDPSTRVKGGAGVGLLSFFRGAVNRGRANPPLFPIRIAVERGGAPDESVKWDKRMPLFEDN